MIGLIYSIFHTVLQIISAIWLVGWIGIFLQHFLTHRSINVPIVILVAPAISVMMRFLKRELLFRQLTHQLIKEPSNDKVKHYTKVVKKMRHSSGSPGFWANIREAYFKVASQEDIDYDLKIELFNALKIMGTIGISYPRKSQRVRKQETEESIREAGEEGERQVRHALDWLDKKRFKVYSDIRLAYQGKSQQFDTVIVGDKAVFNLETKNLTGDLTIHEDGNWYRVHGETKTGTENVNFQVKRHNKVLSSVLQDKVPIVDLIVWANIASVLEGIENSPTKIIKVDQLVDYVESYDEGRSLSPDEVNFAKESIENNKG